MHRRLRSILFQTPNTISYKSKIKPVEVQYQYGGDRGLTKEIS